MFDRKKFITACLRHDWYYQYTDDHHVYTSGSASEKELKAMLASGSEEAEAIHNDLCPLFFSSDEEAYKENVARYKLEL